MKKLRLVRPIKASWLLGVSLLIAYSSVQAITTYQYMGNNYTSITDMDPPSGMYTTDMNLSLSFTVPTPLDMTTDGDISGSVTAYSVNDGRFTLTNSNSRILDFMVTVDVLGNIVDWGILVDSDVVAMGEIFSSLGTSTTVDSTLAAICGSATCNRDSGDKSQFDTAVVFGGGTWSVVPIPAAFWLFGSGLLGLIGVARRKKAA